jgi:hypothetical protein
MKNKCRARSGKREFGRDMLLRTQQRSFDCHGAMTGLRVAQKARQYFSGGLLAEAAEDFCQRLVMNLGWST